MTRKNDAHDQRLIMQQLPHPVVVVAVVVAVVVVVVVSISSCHLSIGNSNLNRAFSTGPGQADGADKMTPK